MQPYNFACFHANRCAVEINWSNGIYNYNWLLSADEIGTSIRKFTCLGWLIWLSACKEWYFCFSRAKKDEEYCCHAILPRRTSLHTCSQAGLKLDHRETRSFFFLIFTPPPAQHFSNKWQTYQDNSLAKYIWNGSACPFHARNLDEINHSCEYK